LLFLSHRADLAAAGTFSQLRDSARRCLRQLRA
jgi:hypothetical protein